MDKKFFRIVAAVLVALGIMNLLNGFVNALVGVLNSTSWTFQSGSASFIFANSLIAVLAIAAIITFFVLYLVKKNGLFNKLAFFTTVGLFGYLVLIAIISYIVGWSIGDSGYLAVASNCIAMIQNILIATVVFTLLFFKPDLLQIEIPSFKKEKENEVNEDNVVENEVDVEIVEETSEQKDSE